MVCLPSLIETVVIEGLGYKKDKDEYGRDTDVNAHHRYRIYVHTMSGTCKKELQKAHDRREGQNRELDPAQQKPFVKLLPIILNDVAKQIFPNAETAYKTQRKYMTNSLFISDVGFAAFAQRLENLNTLLVYFPRFGDQSKAVLLADDQLIDIVERGAPLQWFPIMTERNKLLQNFDNYDDMKEYVRQIERAIAVRKLVAKDSRDSKPQAKEKKRKREDEKKSSVASSPQKKTKSPQKPTRKPCKHCGKYHLNEDKCWSLSANKALRPAAWTEKKTGDNDLKQAKKDAFAAVQKIATLEKKLKSAKQATKQAKKAKDSSDEEGHMMETFMSDSDDDSTVVDMRSNEQKAIDLLRSSSDDSDDEEGKEPSQPKRRKLSNTTEVHKLTQFNLMMQSKGAAKASLFDSAYSKDSETSSNLKRGRKRVACYINNLFSNDNDLSVKQFLTTEYEHAYPFFQ